MNIIASNTTSFEEIINTFITDIKINGLNDMRLFLEKVDQFLYENKQDHMRVVKFKERVIQTTIGMLRFKRRYYFDTFENKYRYLLDAFLEIPKRNRYLDAVKLKIIKAASEMSYEKAGRYACEDGLPASKSTVCRLLKKAEFYIEDNNKIIKNDSKIHLQIDEKFLNVIDSKNKKKYYTATIFKGVKLKGKKRVLQNRTLISGNNLDTFFKRINKSLINKYKVEPEEEIYLSGDLASYIQHAPNRMIYCQAIYVPDKYHIKHAIESETAVIAKDKDLSNKKFLKDIRFALKETESTDGKKLLQLLTTNAKCLKHYMDKEYEGCSQEGMNSHYYATRFGKVPNVWNMETIDKISKIIEAKENDNKVKIGFVDEFYDMPYDLNTEIDFDSCYRELICTEGMPYDMARVFNRIRNGYDANIFIK